MASNETTATGSNTADRIQDQIEQIKDKVIETKDMVTDKASSAVDKLSEMIKARPLVSVGVAFAAGYVLMRVFR